TSTTSSSRSPRCPCSRPRRPGASRCPSRASPRSSRALRPESWSAALAELGEGRCHVCPVALELCGADPADPRKLVRVLGVAQRNLAQRRIVEDDVRGHALLLRGASPPRPQRLEARRSLRPELADDGVPARPGAG